MKLRFVVLSAAVAATSLVLLPATGADIPFNQKTTDPKEVDKGAPTLPDGIAAKDLDASTGVYRSLADVTADALTRDCFAKVDGWLASQDKDRLAEVSKIKVDDINAQVDKINSAYKAKYGKDFAVDNKKAYEGYVLIVSGLITDPDALVGHWPVNQSSWPKAVHVDGKATQADIDQTKAKYFGGRVKLEKDRKVALVRLPARSGLPPITASMIHEAPSSWRFDIPNNISAQDLHDHLLTTLTNIAEKTTWPDDMNEAQRLMTQHIIASLYGVDVAGNVPLTASEK